MPIGRLIASGLVLICTLQAVYWPLLFKPGTVLEWWQVKFLANVGYYIGAPVVIAISVSPLSGTVQNMLAWGLACIWACITYFLIGFICSLIRKSRNYER